VTITETIKRVKSIFFSHSRQGESFVLTRPSTREILLSAASAIAMVTVSQPAFSQDAPVDDNEDLIVVTGIRASVEKSLNDKRSAQQIVDTINSEDIGKSTDQNIAEALNRVSGVSITTNDGEGSLISIRGASPEQTIVTLNGAALGSTGFSQAVDLSSYSADILSKIEIIKTPSADDEEGSLGGLVNLITRKPLELNKNVRTATVQGRWNTQSYDGVQNKPFSAEDYKLSGTVSQKFADDTFGVILSLVDETSSVRRDSVANRNYNGFRSFNAEDQNGTVYNTQSYSDPAIWGIAPQLVAYEVLEGQRDRQALDFAAQWQPMDNTIITGNLSIAKQDIENTQDSVVLRFNDQTRDPNNGPATDAAGNPLYHPSTLPLNNPAFNNATTGAPCDPALLAAAGVACNRFVAPFADPSSWQVVNTETRAWDRILRRYDGGDVNAASNSFSNENLTTSLDFEQRLFDAVTVNVGGSYQKSEQIPDKQVYVNLQSARENPFYLRFFQDPSDLEPHGFDCTSGTCRPVTGSTPVGLGNIIANPTAAQIASLAAQGITGTIGQPILVRGADNTSNSGFNPDDILAKSVGNIFETIRTVEDTNEVLYMDLDYDFNRFGISSFEFGGKYTKREKLVDNQDGRVSNVNAGATVINPLTGQAVLVSNALDQTPVLPFATNVNPRGFLNGIGLGGNAIADGFASVDPLALYNLVRADEGVAIDFDASQTRTAELKNWAAYGKANFDFLENRLTGDIGLRWVQTDVATTGSSGLSAFNEGFGRNQRVYDLRNLRSLMDASQPACPAIPFTPGGHSYGDAARFARVDGLGVDTNGTLTFNDDTPLPNSLPCHEPFLLSPAGLQANGGFIVDLRRYNNIFWTNNDIFTNGFQTTDAAGLNLAPGINNTIRSFATSGSHKYDVFLPNLNVNYAINDEMIGRFAVSRTMTRPEIDSLKPGFSVRETGWGNPAQRVNQANLGNTQLDPLTSTNFDASFEWYFQKDALVSVGLFHKKIKNLLEVEQQRVFLRDIKTEIQNGEEVSTTGLILDENSITIDNCYAEILGEWQYNYNPAYVEGMLFSDDPDFLCAQFQATQSRNAAGASISGMELQYSQNYKFLPGFWGGLGLTANYTYQDSSFDADTSSLVAGATLDRFQIDRTPEHSYNVTAYWEQDGHQLRLAYGGASDVLVQRNFQLGALWEEGRETLDFSGAYKVNDRLTFTLEAQNILDQPIRQYFTSRSIQLPESATDGGTVLVDYNEGNPISGDAYDGRTTFEYNTGTNVRAAIRFTF